MTEKSIGIQRIYGIGSEQRRRTSPLIIGFAKGGCTLQKPKGQGVADSLSSCQAEEQFQKLLDTKIPVGQDIPFSNPSFLAGSPLLLQASSTAAVAIALDLA